ncbi:hypothetical protein ACH518_06595 [Methylomonas sp. HW2-6]|uniref:hypothetical protein n=1 Tax=Methylomonas sp. HW2-6 TaxID=3376687 RepID=UPI0040421B15
MNKSLIFFGLFAVGVIVGASLNFIPIKNTIHIDVEKRTIDLIPPSPDSLSLTDAFVRDVAVRRLNNAIINSNRKVTYEITNVRDGKIFFNETNETELENPGKDALTETIKIGQKLDEPSVDLVDDDGIPISPIRTQNGELVFREYKVTVFPGKIKKIVAKIQDRMEILPFKDIDVSMRPTRRSELVIEGQKEIIEQLEISTNPITWLDNWERADPPSNDSRTKFGWRTKSDGLFPFQGGLLKIAVKKN